MNVDAVFDILTVTLQSYNLIGTLTTQPIITMTHQLHLSQRGPMTFLVSIFVVPMPMNDLWLLKLMHTFLIVSLARPHSISGRFVSIILLFITTY